MAVKSRGVLPPRGGPSFRNGTHIPQGGLVCSFYKLLELVEDPFHYIPWEREWEEVGKGGMRGGSNRVSGAHRRPLLARADL